tara:strand:+ start:1181 stop:2422 length:1242 start_codon:yes stop_codon:yes gene_type:complete
MKYLKNTGKNAKEAQKSLSSVKHKKINLVLQDFNKLLLKEKKKILSANKKDIKKSKNKKLLDRLILDDKKIDEIRKSIKQIEKFKNPLNRILEQWKRPNGLRIKKVTTPIGVIGVIYESRPNVTVDVAALCLKSGNCSILRGGSDAFETNKVLANLFRKSLQKNKLNKNCVQFIEKKDKKIVNYLLSSMTNFIDVIIPRGGKNLVKKVQKFSKVQVIGHLEGLCHIYVDKDANLSAAKKIIVNAKMRRTSICGALETLLIHSKCLKSHGVPIIKKLISSGCEVLVDKKINKIFKNKLELAKKIDWETEYLSPKVSVKSVSSVHDALDHISKYGTMHTDSIISRNFKTAKVFLSRVNSAIAMHNASTQFADGGEFGFGGEVGISTNKLPPRGPVGVDQLTSYKYIVVGKNSVRS